MSETTERILFEADGEVCAEVIVPMHLRAVFPAMPEELRDLFADYLDHDISARWEGKA